MFIYYRNLFHNLGLSSKIPIFFKNASYYGSLPKKSFNKSKPSLLPPGANINFLYFIPLSGFRGYPLKPPSYISAEYT